MVAAMLAIVGVGRPASAWDSLGHKVAAYIAYSRLESNPVLRQRVIEALREHPAYEDWKKRDGGAGDEGLRLFLYASVFPDDAKHMRNYSDWNEPTIHYVDFPVVPLAADYINPLVHVMNPYSIPNVLQAYPDKVRATRLSLDPKERGAALSWVFHLVGDIHQPLHATTGYSAAAFPRGDAGGNGIDVGGKKLHAFWDELLDPTDSEGRVIRGPNGFAVEDLATVKRIAESLLADPTLAPNALPELAQDGSVDAWAQESLTLAKKHIYAPGGPFDLQTRTQPDYPAGYKADCQRVARRRVAVAGYRLADELKKIYGASGP